MVVFVDLDDDELDVHQHDPFEMRDLVNAHAYYNASSDDEDDEGDDRPNPNLNAFSAALGCYPIVCEIASSLDLNSLHDLSRTCRQFRANLLQYRKQLVSHTLRCETETPDVGGRLGNMFREASDAWNTHGPNGVRVPRLTSGKIGTCARDMVGGCRRCGTVVCRNCVIKAPSPIALKTRYRRICRTCIKAPLDEHTHQARPSETSDDHSSLSETPSPEVERAIHRGPCTCETEVWICQPCGATLRTLDTSYMRGWTWRNRYSTYLHGMGTGIGEGVEGVQCGRESSCLAARNIFKEIECDAVDRATSNAPGGSYYLQEIEGIGGVVKKKVKRRCKLGCVVKEYEDERERGAYLRREQDGVNRSWCSWCARIIMSRKDAVAAGELPASDPLGRSFSESETSSNASL